MELIHKIIHNTYEAIIDEPVGFDTMKTTLKRGEYHGMSAQVTVNTLEFCGKVAHFIKSAYDEDIDTEIQYLVLDRYGNVFFSGVLDLSTLVEKQAEYYSVSLKVGEVGVKTMFNNRTTVDVNINTNKTIDGKSIGKVKKYNIEIPSKRIVYTNLMEAKQDVVWTSETAQTGEFSLGENKSHHWLNIPICEKNTLNEFGNCASQAYIAKAIHDSDQFIKDALIGEYYTMLYESGSDFGDKFGKESTYTMEIDITVEVEAIGGGSLFDREPIAGSHEKSYDINLALVTDTAKMNAPWERGATPTGSKVPVLATGDNRRTSDYQNYYSITRMTDTTRKVTIKMQDTLQNVLGDPGYVGRNVGSILYLGVSLRNNNYNLYCYNEPMEMKVTVKAGSYIRMKLDSQHRGNVKSDMVLIGDALNHVIKSISENQLTLHSSLLNTDPSALGNMALLAITNGYIIRGFTDKSFNTSFKEMVEVLDALGCVGWSFGENEGKPCVIVEPWEYFYNDEVVLEIDNPNDKSMQLDNEFLITELIIGYKKYSTNEDINSIDSIHAERTFNTGVKSISKVESKLCQFIADNYAIEEVRRKTLEESSDEFKYDENIFIFELRQNYPNYSSFTIAKGLTNYSGISDKDTYNARISPRRMAEKWRSRLSLFNSQKNIKFTSGKVNFSAAYSPVRERSHSYYTYYDDAVQSVYMKEDNDLTYKTPRMRAEVMKIKYPITAIQYQSIMANPYGLIRVDGVDYWLKEMQYEVTSGETEFKLIPKN